MLTASTVITPDLFSQGGSAPMGSSASSTTQSASTNHSCPWPTSWGRRETEPSGTCRILSATLRCISQSSGTPHPPLPLWELRIRPTEPHQTHYPSTRGTPAAPRARHTWASAAPPAPAQRWTRRLAPWRTQCPGSTSRNCPTVWSLLHTATAAGWPATAWAMTNSPSAGASTQEVTILTWAAQRPAAVLIRKSDRPLSSSSSSEHHGPPAQLCPLTTLSSTQLISLRGSMSERPPADRLTAYPESPWCRVTCWAESRGWAWGVSWAPSSLRVWWSRSWTCTHTLQTCLSSSVSSRATGAETLPTNLHTHMYKPTHSHTHWPSWWALKCDFTCWPPDSRLNLMFKVQCTQN